MPPEGSSAGHTGGVSQPSRTRQPTWFVAVLGVALALLIAALTLFALQALGAEQVGGGFVLLIAGLSAVAGGFAARALAARLPPVSRPR